MIELLLAMVLADNLVLNHMAGAYVVEAGSRRMDVVRPLAAATVVMMLAASALGHLLHAWLLLPLGLEALLPLLAKGGFYHAGQVCVSVQRVFAHEKVADRLADGLAELAGQQRIGDPTREDTDVGPLIRHPEAARVAEWVEEAAAQGGRVLGGGRRISDSCYACTVIADPPPEARVSCQEIFGPVICVYRYRDMDEALVRANSLPYAFQAAVFTRDLDRALRAAKRLDASAVMINDHTAFRVDWMPFAGLRQSGLGVGGIPHTMRDMQVEKMLVFRSPEW